MNVGVAIDKCRSAEKVGCPAKIFVYEHVEFPQFAVSNFFLVVALHCTLRLVLAKLLYAINTYV